MTISPLDVRNQVFKRRLRGFDVDEVKMFLDAVADRMEEMLKDKEALERDNSILREKADCLSELESALRAAMVTAQRISEDTKTHAQKEADVIVKEAEMEARRKITEAMSQVEDLVRTGDRARSEVVAFIAKIRSLLESQLSLMGDIEREVRTSKSPEREGLEIGKDVGP